MNFETDELAKFIGGQLEVQNPAVGYTYRGGVRDIRVEGDMLTVSLKWMAKAQGGGMIPSGWEPVDTKDYAVSLGFCTPIKDKGWRIIFQYQGLGENVVLYLPGFARFDPAKVEGLLEGT